MSPEQVRGEPATDAMDIYAFGILLFELLTGQKPVEGDTLERLFFAILNENLKPEPMVRPALRPRLSIWSCVAPPRTGRRPRSFTEVIAALARSPIRFRSPVMRRPAALIGAIGAVCW